MKMNKAKFQFKKNKLIMILQLNFNLIIQAIKNLEYSVKINHFKSIKIKPFF